MSQGKHSATTKIRYAALNRIVARLSGRSAVVQAVTAERARRSLTALAAAAASTARVAVILGSSGEAHRPVIVRLLVVPRAAEAAVGEAGSSRGLMQSGLGHEPLLGLMPLCAPSEARADDELECLLNSLGMATEAAPTKLASFVTRCDVLWDEFMQNGGLDECDELLELSALPRSRTPSPGMLEGRPQRRAGLMMMSEAVWEYPPGTVSDDACCVPGLCDDGASYNAGCSRTLAGAILDTYSADGECRMSVGVERIGAGPSS